MEGVKESLVCVTQDAGGVKFWFRTKQAAECQGKIQLRENKSDADRLAFRASKGQGRNALGRGWRGPEIRAEKFGTRDDLASFSAVEVQTFV